MYVLALDTTGASGSLALFHSRELVSQKTWSYEGSHSERLTAAFIELLDEAHLQPEQLHRVAVGIGPGSFTGIRVGVNFARALGYALRIPVFNLNSLHLLASQPHLPQDRPICVLQYAFRNLIYLGQYALDKGRAIETQPPLAVTVDQLPLHIQKPHTALGHACENLKTQIPESVQPFLIRDPQLRDSPLAADFSQTLALDESCPSLTDWIHTIPLYIRASEAEEKMRSGALKPYKQ